MFPGSHLQSRWAPPPGRPLALAFHHQGRKQDGGGGVRVGVFACRPCTRVTRAYLITEVTCMETPLHTRTHTRTQEARLVSMPVGSAASLTSLRLDHCMWLYPPSACSLRWTQHTHGCPPLGSLSYSSSHLVFKAGGHIHLITWSLLRLPFSGSGSKGLCQPPSFTYVGEQEHTRMHVHTHAHTLACSRVPGQRGINFLKRLLTQLLKFFQIMCDHSYWTSPNLIEVKKKRIQTLSTLTVRCPPVQSDRVTLNWRTFMRVRKQWKTSNYYFLCVFFPLVLFLPQLSCAL